MKKILSAVFVLTFSLAATAGGGQPQPTVQGLLRTVLQECDGATDAAQLTPGCRAAIAEYKARIPAETAKIRQMDLAQIDRAQPVRRRPLGHQPAVPRADLALPNARRSRSGQPAEGQNPSTARIPGLHRQNPATARPSRSRAKALFRTRGKRCGSAGMVCPQRSSPANRRHLSLPRSEKSPPACGRQRKCRQRMVECCEIRQKAA